MKKTISYFSIAILVSFALTSMVYANFSGERLAFDLAEGKYKEKRESLPKGYAGISVDFNHTKETTAGISISRESIFGKKLLKRCNVNVKIGTTYICRYTKGTTSNMHIGTVVRNSGKDNSGVIEGYFYLTSNEEA